MAENKNKIIVYRDWKATFDLLDDETAGKLIKHFFAYVNDENPEPENFTIKLAFEPMKATLKRDLKKWEGVAERNRINGRKGGRPKKPKKPNGLNQNPKNPEKADSDSVSDTVSDSVILPSNEGVYKEVTALKSEYLENDKICNAVINNPKNKIENRGRLEVLMDEFTLHLVESGEEVKTFKDFSKHFINWTKKKKEKASGQKEKRNAADLLKEKYGLS